MENPFLAKNTSQKPIAGVDPALRERLLVTGQTQKLAELEQTYKTSQPSFLQRVGTKIFIDKSAIPIKKTIATALTPDVLKPLVGSIKFKEPEVRGGITSAFTAIPRWTARTAISVAQDIAERKTGISSVVTPQTEEEKAIIGEEPIKAITAKGGESRIVAPSIKAIGKFINPKATEEQLRTAALGPTLAVAAFTDNPFLAGIGKSAQFSGKILKAISKSSKAEEIFNFVKPLFKGKTDEELLKLSDELVSVVKPQKVGEKLNLFLKESKGISQAPKIEKVINEASEQVDGVKGINISQAKASGQSFDEWVKGQGNKKISKDVEVVVQEAQKFDKIEDFVTQLERKQGFLQQDAQKLNSLRHNTHTTYNVDDFISDGLEQLDEIERMSKEYFLPNVKEDVIKLRKKINKTTKNKLSDTKSELNNLTEDFMFSLDTMYGTDITPTGWARTNSGFGSREPSSLYYENETITNILDDNLSEIEDILKTRSQLKAEWDKITPEPIKLQGEDVLNKIKPTNKISNIAKQGEELKIPEKPKTLFQKIGEAGKEIETPKAEIKNFDDVVIERPKKMNALAKRIIESDVMPEETRAFVRENPSSYHEVLSDKEMRSLIDSLKEDELRAVFYEDESKASTFAGQKLVKKLQSAGRFEEANEIITRAEKIATKGGQITQAQKIWADWLTPEGKLFDIKKKLSKEGRKLRPEDEKDLFDTFTKNDKLKNDLDDIVDKARETLDPKYFDEHKKLLKQYNDDLRQLQKKMSGLLPRKISDTLSTIMQGNILTPLSQIKNPLYNAFFLPFKITQKSIATLGDAVYSFVRSKPRTVKMSSPISYLKGFGKGIKEAGGIFIKGSLPDDAGKIDNYRAFYPIRALASAFTGKGLPVSEKTGKVLVYDRVNKLIEGILGGPPEAMFRLLAFGDKPFYQATRSSVANELANLKGLTGMEKRIFTEFPEALSDDVIEVAARESVFQQDSTISKGVNKGIEMLGKIKGIGGLAKFLARTQAIFVKTPVNVVSETLDFLVPPLSFAKGINAASKGKRRDALLYLGKATTGLMVNAVSAMLVKQGLVNGDLYEGKKQEALEYEAIPPRTINLTGIKRMVSGDNPKYKSGDTTIRYDILGILGASLEMQFAASKDEETPDNGGAFDASMNVLSDGIKDVFRIGNFAMQQSFLQGTNTLLETIANVDSAQGETQLNNWFKNTFNLITAIPLPNTLGAMTRTSDVYTRETKGKTASETFDNVIKERLFGTYDLPAKLGLFGEKILRTPEGRNAFVFNMVDPFKFQKIKNDRTYLELNDLYSKTKDVSVIPSIPTKSYTKDNETIEMNGKQYELYASLIGRQRKELVDEAVQSDFWTKLDNETKIDLLSNLYKKGMDAGKAKYFDEDIDVNPNSSILKWQYANDNPRATRIDYGYYLASIGEDTNKSGEASKNDWDEYNEMVGKLQKSKTTNKNPFVR
jgi:hypothetical protein